MSTINLRKYYHSLQKTVSSRSVTKFPKPFYWRSGRKTTITTGLGITKLTILWIVTTALKTEEKIAGNVPESLFRKIFADYECELSELQSKAADIRQHMQQETDSESDVKNWMALIKDCVSIKSLDRATAFQLIDNVAVHEQTDERGHRS